MPADRPTRSATATHPACAMVRLQAAAAEVAEVQWCYAQRGLSLASAALAGATQFHRWAHHPRNDLIDPVLGTRCFYHAHDAAECAPGEHGHFHVFAPVPPAAVRPAQPDFVHLVGISLGADGLPLRLFTTNRWVTGEHWLGAPQLQPLLADFGCSARGRLAPVARWVQGIVRLHAELIGELLVERDAILQAASATAVEPTPAQPSAAALDDRHRHIVSQHPINLLHRLAEVGLPGDASRSTPRRH